jgi:hypothetical protein
MAQIIDFAERRKPRALQRQRIEASMRPWVLGPTVYLDQFVAPIASCWQSWLASWGSLWLAPWGLQVLPIEPPRPVPENRAGPRG